MLGRIKSLIKNYIIWIAEPKKMLFDDNGYLKEAHDFSLFISRNKDIHYVLKYGKKIDTKFKHNWVGAQCYNSEVICIPNDENRLLKTDNEFLGAVADDELFKWTGGTIWDNKIYCFPRTANSFLVWDGKEMGIIPLIYKYEKEHHYGGVCTNKGIVYQPPRDSNHILKTDLNTGKSDKIMITPKCIKGGLRYCGAVIHPNGLIYFLPENNKVIVLNPQNDEWAYIGKKVQGMVFDAKVGTDGNIYGFSSYGTGIIKITTCNNTVQMIHSDKYFGAYGTKYGVNGLLYSVPGDGKYIWSYDIQKDALKVEHDLHMENKAKYAGGVTDKRGNIICAPATENKVLYMIPDRKVDIPDNIYNRYYRDFY